MEFIDEVTIEIQSGNGGKGCESYNRRMDKKIVPNGGNGGKGGDVIIRADRNLSTLYPFRFNKHFRAPSGQQGSSSQMTGRDAEPILIKVPCGTTIFDKGEGLVIRDLVDDGDEVIALKGGEGGRGNQYHGRQATPGQPGRTIEIVLSLTLNADIFLVGTPNAGKSLLLNRLTGSKAKSEAYPFTTRVPLLGIYQNEDYESLSLCELPSLMPGSHEGRGLGNKFLKHLTRAKMMFIVADGSAPDFDAKKTYQSLIDEIVRYNASFESIPHFYVINKIDEPEAAEKLKRKISLNCPVFKISAKTGEGVEALIREAEKKIFHEKQV